MLDVLAVTSRGEPGCFASVYGFVAEARVRAKSRAGVAAALHHMPALLVTHGNRTDRVPGADGPLARPPGALPAPLSLRAHAP